MGPDQPTGGNTVTARVSVPESSHRERMDTVFLTLLGATVFFSLVAVAISKWSPNDGQTFQLICGLTTGFAGACLGRVKPSQSGAAASTTTVTEPPK